MSIAGQVRAGLDGLRAPKAAVLIDYDNIEGLRNAPSPERFAYVLAQLVDGFLEQVGESVDQLLVRLYGGWDEAGTLTQRASQLAQYMSDADPFPLLRNGSTVPGAIELALGPIDRPGLSLPNTFRRRNGSIRLRRNPDLAHPSCPNDHRCGARQLAKWTKSATKVCPTESCVVTSAEAFLVSEQKMIDTLMTTDLLSWVYANEDNSVCVVSDDSDFLPPLIHAANRAQEARVVLLTSIEWDEGLVRILETSSVQIRRVSL